MQKKIILIGGFGWQDIGDEAMPQTVIINLKKSIPELDIIMLSPNPEYTIAYHKERSIPDINIYLREEIWIVRKLKSFDFYPFLLLGKIINHFCRRLIYICRCIYFIIAAKFAGDRIFLPINKDAKRIIEEIRSAKLIFNNGGGNINSLFPDEMYKQCSMMLAAFALKVPIVVSGQTMGPYTKTIHRWIVKKAINRTEIITFRDLEVSKNRVKEIGVKRPTLLDTADDAISLPFLTKEDTIKMIVENGGEEWLKIPTEMVFVLNMNGYRMAMGKAKQDSFSAEVELFAVLGNYFIKKHNAKIIMVPTDYALSSDDRPLLAEVKRRIENGKTIVIEKEYDAIQLKSLIGFGDFAIGSRYHFLVFAASMAVPFIGLANGIYQKTKLKGLLDLYGLSEYSIEEDMCKVSNEYIIMMIEKILEKKKEIRNKLIFRTKNLKEASLVTIQRSQILCERPLDRGIQI